MISSADVATAEFVVDQSGIVEILVDGYRRTRRGRPPNRVGLRLMLIGLYLSTAHEGKATLTNAFRVLTQRLGVDAKVRLGVVGPGPDGPRTLQVSLDDFYNLERVLTDKLAYSENSRPDLEDGERLRRHEVLRCYCDALMGLFPAGEDTSTLAVDATGIWSWGRGVRTSGIDVAGDGAGTCEEAEVDECVGSQRRVDRDARWGVKTAKSGRDETFFGYHEHTLVQVADSDRPGDAVPPLIAGFELTPADHDVVDVTLSLLDRLPGPVKDLIVDRHYSYKKVERWMEPLLQRGISQHLDLRSTDAGFVEFDRMRWAAGSAHCPSTPDHLGEIQRPGPAGTDAEKAEFRRLIDQREAFAMNRHTTPVAMGKHRVMCPALAGKAGCALRPGTVQAAVEAALPVVKDPPSVDDAEGLPACCSQQTVMVTPPEQIRKLMQPNYWGSAAWERIWSRRTHVEGSYGNRKNPSTENVRRGHFQVFGLVWVHLVMGLVNASYNVRMLRNFCERNPDHPLTEHEVVKIGAVVDDTVGHMALTEAEFELLQRQRSLAA